MTCLVISAFSHSRLHQTYRNRKQARKSEISKLEQANRDRIAALQQHTCFCQQSDWNGAGCETHGVPPANVNNNHREGEGKEKVEEDAPGYEEIENHDRPPISSTTTTPAASHPPAPPHHDHPPPSITVTHPAPAPPNDRQHAIYRQGQEDGFLASTLTSFYQILAHRRKEKEKANGAPAPMGEDEVRRINRERRRRMGWGWGWNLGVRFRGDKRVGRVVA